MNCGRAPSTFDDEFSDLWKDFVSIFRLMNETKNASPREAMVSLASWKVKRTLERNRSLLKSLRNTELKAEEAPNDWLVRRGFDFNYHTHVLATDEGNLMVMCFDEGYVVEEGQIQPCLDASSRSSSRFAR